MCLRMSARTKQMIMEITEGKCLLIVTKAIIITISHRQFLINVMLVL